MQAARRADFVTEYISQTEDLKGVFIVPPPATP